MARDSWSNTLMVATVLCVACSVLVASAAVGLRDRQQANRRLDQMKNVLIAADLFDPQEHTSGDIERIFAEKVDRVIINIDTGEPVGSDEIDPATFDQRRAARDPEMSVPVAPQGALSGIRRREKYSFVYLVNDEAGELDQVVFPVYGVGLWSILFGFISVDSDANTVRGLTFYEHGETPGLGGEVDNQRWQAQWRGKKLFDDENWDEVELRVEKGVVPSDAPNAEHKIDGLSGATITANGVTAMVQYWLGSEAFGNYLDKLRASSGGPSRG